MSRVCRFFDILGLAICVGRTGSSAYSQGIALSQRQRTAIAPHSRFSQQAEEAVFE